mmetsp:Transcript_131134/g.227003  ORF Transcript_131134/g.227003 Transcript_131134/m.227003 type:complete len:147 (-) Transcript_131134:41-481(-)
MGPKKGKADAEPVVEEPQTGSGVYYFPDGSKYEGAWAKAGNPPIMKRHGTGTYTEGTNIYTGQWVDDQMTGQGKFTFASGAVYEGEWLHNNFDGRGSYVWPDGSRYEGLWRCSKMHGEGMYQDLDGQRWHGRFYNGGGPGLNKELL